MAVRARKNSAKSTTAGKSMTTPRNGNRKISLKRPKKINFTYVLAGFSLVVTFLLGILITEVYHLKNAAPVVTTAPNGQVIVPPKPLHVAKAIGMNEGKFKTCLESGKYTDKVNQDLALGQSAGVDGTPAPFINKNFVPGGAIPYADFKVYLDQAIADPSIPIPSITPTSVDIYKSPFPALGNADAPVTVVEFADFQCPFCEQWFKETESQLIKDYVKAGKVKFVFQNYAFLGPDSTTAAIGAYCAQEQGKFWPYHDFLYNHQGAEQSGWASVKNLL